MSNDSKDKIDNWIKEISFKCLPKSIECKPPLTDDSSNEIIHNVRSADSYEITSVNYFVSAPIELHIFDVLWSISVGNKIDNELLDTCFGNRLYRDSKNHHNIETAQLFKIFHYQYEDWRDTAIKKARAALENDTDILLVGLDLIKWTPLSRQIL